MKKKIVSLCLVVALLAIAIVGATLAYFTDTKEEVNTFTVGSVEIDLLESQLHRVNDNATDEEIIADDLTYQDEYLAELGKDIVPGRWVKKAPYILNTGNNAAYVRTRLLIPTELFTNNPGLEVMLTTTAAQEGAISAPEALGTVEINGVLYNAYNFTYAEPLEPSEMTYWPAFWEVRLTTNCDLEDIAAFIDAGVITADGQFNIIVQADAIQAETFASAEEAFAAFDAQENA